MADKPVEPQVPVLPVLPRGWRTREEYRAYMREYMRRYREKKKNG